MNEGGFWCHQCKKHIHPIPAEQEDEEYMCPTCHSNFVEMIEGDADEELLQSAMDSVFSENTQQHTAPLQPPQPQITAQVRHFTFGPNGVQTMQPQFDINAFINSLFVPPPPVQQNNRDPNQQTQQNSPFMFNLTNLMNTLMNPEGAGAIVGDYVLGGNFDQIIQQMLDRFDGPIGTPPASKDAIKKLATTVVSEENCDLKDKECPVCQDHYAEGDKLTQMPCQHWFHTDCLIPWLELHSNCPVCRKDIPTQREEEAQNQSQNPNVQQPQRQQQQQQFIWSPFNIFGGNNNNTNNRRDGTGGAGDSNRTYFA
jgi:E3 ubiquitin-protein ligase RNF115/126